MDIQSLKEHAVRQVHRAGPRYTPAVDPTAPNLTVAPLVKALDAIGHTTTYQAHLRKLADDVLVSWDRAPRHVCTRFRGLVQHPGRLSDLTVSIANSAPGATENDTGKLVRAVRFVSRVLEKENFDLLRQATAENDEASRSQLQNEAAEFRRLAEPVNTLLSYTETPAFQLIGINSALLLGEWGTGKTHFLCDVALRRLEQGLPTLLVLAESLPREREPLSAIAEHTGLASSSDDLLERLDELGRKQNCRALLLVDAINEGDRHAWREYLEAMTDRVASHVNLGFVVSCRRPFEEQILTSGSRRHLITIEHPGFVDMEIDAQLEFFAYYEVPSPSAPLLTPEFSRPLFLKLLCESLRDLARKTKADRLRDITSGQKGMTHILEHFARRVGRRIEDELGLPPKTCWKILKGQPAGAGQRRGIAPLMAARVVEHLPVTDCESEIQACAELDPGPARTLLRRMVEEGLLADGIAWDVESQQRIDVIRFPYQRFGDHLIARHLLESHLRTDSETAIRRSFWSNRVLGRIFEIDEGGYSFRHPGLAAAIMIEFPERVKRVLPRQDRELVTYLPRRCSYVSPLRDVFLDGLEWRSADSISEKTDHVVGFFLNHDWTRDDTLEVLVSLATRPGHPYAASRLYAYLAGRKMPDRDLTWSEFLRHRDRESVVYRLLEWVEHSPERRLTPAAAENVIRLLSLFLTTTQRLLRDRVTRALVLVGQQTPKALFEVAKMSLEFNDPYVPERMLAACYGVAMTRWADPRGRAVRRELPAFGRDLFQLMFSRAARFSTTHALSRDYALGVIQLLLRICPSILSGPAKRLLQPSFSHLSSPFRSPESVSEEEIGATDRAIRMDFGNYTIGRLIPDRGNYDYENPTYKVVRREIQGRMYDLGYSHNRFGSLDEGIGQANWYASREGNKVDRYGKKYSWIAYFEMYGLRSARRELAEYNIGERTSDCDIDPSFPAEPATWRPSLPDVFSQPYLGPEEWLPSGPDPDYGDLLRRGEVDGVQGPWALLDGFIEQASHDDPRRVFTFLRGLLVPSSDVQRLRALVHRYEYLGNQRLPEPYDDHYTFAGEVPWSKHYGQHLRNADGAASPNVQGAFAHFRDGEQIDEIQLEVPVHSFTWESYHSALNQVGSVSLLAPALAEHLELVNHGGTFELYERSGRQATLCRVFEDTDDGYSSRLLYIREDLLQAYLTYVESNLVWVSWGERTLHHNSLNRLSASLRELLGTYCQVHKNSVEYQP